MKDKKFKNINIVERKGVGVTTLVSSTFIMNPWNAHTEVLFDVYTELLLRGAGKYSREAFQDALGQRGSSIGVKESDGKITMTLSALDEHLEETLGLLRLLIKKPAFTSKEFKNTKLYLTNQLDILKEDARYVAEQQFSTLVFDRRDPRYRYSVSALKKEIASVTLREVRDLHKNLTSNAWLHTIGGSTKTTTHVTSFIPSVFGKQKRSKNPYITKIKTPKMELSNIPSKSNIEFALGYQTDVSFESKDYPALFFGLSVLGIPGGFAGRLMSTVREKEGLTYSIYLFADSFHKVEPVTIRVYTFFAPPDARKGIISTFSQIDAIVRKGITEDELKRFKSILHTRNALTTDALSKLISKNHQHLLHDISETEYEDFAKKIQKLTVSEVNEALREHLSRDNISIAGAGPIKQVEKELKSKLKT